MALWTDQASVRHYEQQQAQNTTAKPVQARNRDAFTADKIKESVR
jgi:hypothetical protein